MIYIGIIMTIFYLMILLWLASGILNYSTTKTLGFLPGVSVIISAHNEEKNIKILLGSLINQTYLGEYEIIIANDRSNDLTKQIITDYIKKYNYIDLIDITETAIGWGNKKWALHQCINKSQYNIIIQTDADCIPGSGWIESMAQQFDNPNVVFISAPSPLMSNHNKLSEFYKLDSLAQDALSAGGMSHNLSFSCTGRNMGFLKKKFKDINGYENIEHYISGDDDLLLQKFATMSNGKIAFNFNAEAIVPSPPPKSMDEFLNQRIRYGSKAFEYYKLNTTKEFKILLPFLYIINLISLVGFIMFVEKIAIIYLAPILIKIVADYWLCSSFIGKISEKINIKAFIVLSIIHPIYITSLGILSPFIGFKWKSNDIH